LCWREAAIVSVVLSAATAADDVDESVLVIVISLASDNEAGNEGGV